MDAPATPAGPLDWRRIVEWLRADGVIASEEADRTIARCAQAESRQHPLVRLAMLIDWAEIERTFALGASDLSKP